MQEGPYVVVWEFQVKQDREAEFMAAYDPEGEWAQLFRRSPEFLDRFCSYCGVASFGYVRLAFDSQPR